MKDNNFKTKTKRLAKAQSGMSRKQTEKSRNRKFNYGGARDRNLNAIYNPPRKKRKGYQNDVSTFNKTK